MQKTNKRHLQRRTQVSGNVLYADIGCAKSQRQPCQQQHTESHPRQQSEKEPSSSNLFAFMKSIAMKVNQFIKQMEDFETCKSQ